VRAAVITRFGGPEVLEVREVPEPEPGPGEVSIEVAYAGVNYVEAMVRRGEYRPADPPFVLGEEVSGWVRAVGDEVEDLRPGQPVAALTLNGGYAEVAVAPAAMTHPLDGLGAVDLATAAGMPVVVPTAYAIFAEAARLREGEAVLIHAAAGGLGTVAAQTARALGAGLVLGTVGSKGKAAYAEAFGYDRVFVRDGFAEATRGATEGRGADVILDSIGGAVRAESFEALAPFGRLVVIGNASGADEDLPVTGADLRGHNASAVGFSISALAEQFPGRLREVSREAFGLVGSGAVRLDVTDVVALERVAEVHRRIEDRSTTGKLLLEVGGTAGRGR
jgi:NADPH2:quinone reductase